MSGPQTLTDDYFSIDEEKIKQIETVLTIVNGKVELLKVIESQEINTVILYVLAVMSFSIFRICVLYIVTIN
jgi:hypothetical protein